MKKTLILLVLLTGILVLRSYSQKKPLIQFKNTTKDYGNINEEKGPAITVFDFVNIGNDTLLIISVQPGCGCTASEWTKKPVLPGEKGFIKAIYNPKNRPGVFHKGITVNTNDPVKPRVVLTIKGNVIPRPKTTVDYYLTAIGNLRFKSNHLAFLDTYIDEVKTDTMMVYNNWNKPMKLSFSELPRFLSIKAVPTVLDPKKEGLIIITYDAVRKNDWGLCFDKFKMYTNDVNQPIKNLNVSAKLVEDFSRLNPRKLAKAPKIKFSGYRYNFEKVKQGAKIYHDFEFTNTGKKDLIIRKIKVSCDCTIVTPEKKVLKKSETSKINVLFNTSGRKGPQHKTVTIITNDPQNQSVLLHIEGAIIR